ncbi:MAG TPA: hypothetical protein VJU80_08700 [Solirubrobacteraceae bacterium]|nr:hypothetical protein [Solirubrobacteraceae bacterium]
MNAAATPERARLEAALLLAPDAAARASRSAMPSSSSIEARTSASVCSARSVGRVVDLHTGKPSLLASPDFAETRQPMYAATEMPCQRGAAEGLPAVVGYR